MPHEDAIRALPFVSIRGRRYVDEAALLAYLDSLASPPAPPAAAVTVDTLIVEDLNRLGQIAAEIEESL